MNDSDHLPPERKLPPRRRDQILRSVLSGEEPPMSSRVRVRWIAPIAVAGAAALIAVGAVALTGGDDGQSDGQPPAGQTETIPLDLGALTDAEMVEELRKSRPGSYDEYTFPYARRIDGPAEPVPAIVATTDRIRVFRTGKLTGKIWDAPMPMPAHPIREIDPELDRPDIGDDIYRDTEEFRKIAGIYRVADTVDRIEVRVGTPYGTEPWRVAEPYGGYVFWATWFAFDEYEPGTELTVKWRAYDTDGHQIDPALLPDQPRTITVPADGQG